METFTNLLGTLGTTGTAATSVLSTENSARSGRNSANTTSLSNLKTTLAATRAKQETAADRLYRNSEQGGWNAYLIGVQNANTAYLTSQKTAENTYKTAADAADATYRAASVTAYTNYHQSIHALDTAFYAAVTDANDANFTTTAYFTTTATGANPNLSFQKTTLVDTSSPNDRGNVLNPEPIMVCMNDGQNVQATRVGGWAIIRNSRCPNATAVSVQANEPSTVASLAQAIGLDPNECQCWLKPTDNRPMDTTNITAPLEGTFSIPNTILSTYAGEGVANTWNRIVPSAFAIEPILTKNYVRYDDEIDYLRSLGFYVEDMDVPEEGGHADDFVKRMYDLSSDGALQGINIAYPHGDPPPNDDNGNRKDNVYLNELGLTFCADKSRLLYSTLRYKEGYSFVGSIYSLGFVVIKSCHSELAKWYDITNDNTIFGLTGIDKVLDPSGINGAKILDVITLGNYLGEMGTQDIQFIWEFFRPGFQGTWMTY